MTIASLLPFYLVCDISASMRDEGRIDALNDVVAATCDAAAMHPVIADRVRIGVMSFASEANVVLPLCDVGLLARVPLLAPRGLTSYASAFRLALSTIKRDVAQLVADGYRVFRPAMFFLTDGHPTDPVGEWRTELAALLDPAFPHRPNVIAFGFGDAPETLLAEIATMRAYVAIDAMTAPAAIAGFGSLLVQSVVASGTSGTLELPDQAPDGLEPLDDLDLL